MQSTATRQDRRAARLLVEAARTPKLWRPHASSCSTCAALRQGNRVNSQLYSTALSRDQASLVFGLAVKMVRINPDLSGVLTVRETAKQIACPKLGTVYRALSADAGTNFGLSPALVVHDELGQIRAPRSSLYEAMETATAAQEEPLTVIISTQAPTDADLLSVLIDDAKAGA